MKTIETYLPLFSGFYGTYWEGDDKIEQEIEHLNELRAVKGLEPIDYDACQFDYKDYEMQVVKGIAQYLERELVGFVNNITIQGVVSPREYNFYNDSANVVITLSKGNIELINSYLSIHSTEFAAYLKERYTSCSGFISSYPNNIEEFMEGEPLEHKHKLGAILDFICECEGIEEINAYYNVEAYIQVSNYSELIPD